MPAGGPSSEGPTTPATGLFFSSSIGGDQHREHCDEPRRRDFLPHLAAVRPDAVVLSGDIAEQPTPASMLEFVAKAQDVPVLFALGNHDACRDTFDGAKRVAREAAAFRAAQRARRPLEKRVPTPVDCQPDGGMVDPSRGVTVSRLRDRLLVAVACFLAGDQGSALAQFVPRPVPPVVRPVPRPRPPPPRPPVNPSGLKAVVRPPVQPRMIDDERGTADDDEQDRRGLTAMIIVGVVVLLSLLGWSTWAAASTDRDDDFASQGQSPPPCPRCAGTGKLWQAIDGGPWEVAEACPQCRTPPGSRPTGGGSARQ